MKMLDVFDESTNEKLGQVPSFNGAEMDEMVERAYKAQPKWENTPIFERARILYKFLALVDEHTDEIAMLCAKNIGKPILQGLAETAYSADIGRENIERAKHVYGEVLNDNAEGYENNLLFVKREALGVVVAIIPFNYPVELTIQKAVPAMIMGNSIIVKASTTTPIASYRLVQLAHEAGVPEDIIQFVTGNREDCNKYLLTNPKVACLALTGSTEAGTEMIKNSAETIKKVILELGGNDALIIREDCADDPEQIMLAVSSVIGGRVYENNGQVCASPKRIVIHRKAKDLFIKVAISLLEAMPRGHASDPKALITRLVSAKAAEKVEAQVNHTVKQGAKIIYGGNRNGCTYDPTILDNVTPDMDIAKDMEVFGPVMPLITFDTDEEALEIANNSKYGLSSAVITKDIMKALWFADKIEASACVINGTSALRHHDQPFGGCKATGIGNEGACCSAEEYSRLKTYHICNVYQKEAFHKDNGMSELYVEATELFRSSMQTAIDKEFKK